MVAFLEPLYFISAMLSTYVSKTKDIVQLFCIEAYDKLDICIY